MPGDALNYHYVARELNDFLSGGRIEKITMPALDKIILLIRNEGKNYSLLISSGASCARCHLTDKKFDNPVTAPSFLMHLRKHIGGGKINSVTQVPYERIIRISITAKNELQMNEDKVLIAEIMGKYSNIILLNPSGIISESIRHITDDLSSKRVVLPGFNYIHPPKQDKIDLSNETELKELLEGFQGATIQSYIQSHVSGLAPSTITEAIVRTFKLKNIDKIDEEKAEKLAKVFMEFYNENSFKPCAYLQDNRAVDFCFSPYQSKNSERKDFETLNEAMNFFYSDLDVFGKIDEKATRLKTILKNLILKTEKRLATVKENYDIASDCEEDKKRAELILANIYKIKQGQNSVIVEDYYNDNEELKIELDSRLSPQANAQKGYKIYNKKKKTIENCRAQIEKLKDDLDYLDTINISFTLSNTSEDFDEIAKELDEFGAFKNKKGSITQQTKKSNNKKVNNNKKSTTSNYLKFDYLGYKINVGKNNLQNDTLTKNAKSADLWLHTKDIHGSHVVIENPQKTLPPNEVILYAASLAAAYSKGSRSDKVAVDYTFAKFVNKPSGAALGRVIYGEQHTVFVSPSKNEKM